MSALHREWINDQAERVTLEAPELRPVGQVPCVPTSTGLLIGCAYRRPMPQPSADAERIQAALLAKPARRASDGWAFWLTLLACVLVFALLSGCGSDALIASHNLSKAADNFEISRRIVFYNGITDAYILTMEGRCSIETTQSRSFQVTCKTGPNEYKKHFLGLSDNVTYFAEQLTAADVSEYHYRVVFKPQSILPEFDFRGDAGEALRNRN